MGLNDEERKTMVGLELEKAKGDYNCLFDVTKDELLTFVEPAKELVVR